MESQLMGTPKGSIEYTLRGRGPVILVCHGTSSDCHSAALVMPLLDAGFAVLTPSRPGYGQTRLEWGLAPSKARWPNPQAPMPHNHAH